MTRSEDVTYEAGFRPKGTDPGQYPHVLIQKVPGEIERASYDEVRRGFAKALRLPVKSVEGTTKEPTLGVAVLDRSRNRLAFMEKLKAPGVGPVRGLSVGHLGESGVVFVHCYAEEDGFAEAKPTFDQLNDSFRFDLGYEFQPAGYERPKKPAKKDADDVESAADSAGEPPDLTTSLIVGGVVTVVVGAFMWVVFKAAGPSKPRRGRRPARRRRDAYDD
jgi:hypothetical protein